MQIPLISEKSCQIHVPQILSLILRISWSDIIPWFRELTLEFEALPVKCPLRVLSKGISSWAIEENQAPTRSIKLAEGPVDWRSMNVVAQ